MDIKLNLYDSYLTSDMGIPDLIYKLDEIQHKSVKNKGVVYTPLDIVNKIIEIASPNPAMRIIEPACGHGIFLFGLFEHMQRVHALTGPELYNWFINKVIAIDISEMAIEELTTILTLYFIKNFNMDGLVFNNVFTADGLYYQPTNDIELCIGNPPYVRTRNLEPTYLTKLRNNFSSCKKGNVDIYYAFIEKYATITDQVCLITPNSFLANVSAKALRELITDRISVLIDFKDTIMFKDVRTYTCIFNITKHVTTDVSYANNLTSTLVVVDKNAIFKKHNIINSTLQVMSGIATLCDAVFKTKKINNKYYATFNGVNHQIEREMVVPLLKLTKLNNITNYEYIIFPYDKQKEIISESELQTVYPLTYAYLLSVRHKLELRDKGKTSKYDAWYAYGRKQGLHTITDNEVIIIPIMIGNSCKPIKLDISDILTEFGMLLFTSGFIVPYSHSTSSFLDDAFLEFVTECGKPWPGNYHSITTKHIKSFTL